MKALWLGFAALCLLVIFAAWAAVTTDNFNRASSLDLGANWNDDPGGSEFQIINNTQLQSTDGCNFLVRYDGGSAPGNDQYSQITLVTRRGGADNGDGPAVRLGSGVPGASNGIFLQCGATDCRVYEETNSGMDFTQLGSTVAAAANGSVLKIQVVGSAVTAYDDAVSIITGTATLTSGRAGIWGCSGNGNGDTVMDDFSFDTIGAAVNIPLKMNTYKQMRAH